MKAIYFNHKRKIKVVEPLEYLKLADSEYRTLNRKRKWTAAKHSPAAGFFGDNEDGGGSVKYNEDGNKYKRNFRKRWNKIQCHNCGKLGHIAHNCTLPGVGQSNATEDEGTSSPPVASGFNMCQLPTRSEPRVVVLSDGHEIKWCGKCASWGPHWQAACPGTTSPSVVVLSDNTASAPTSNPTNMEDSRGGRIC